nr:hypothetical protein [Tanacetum cinerariifolium]
MPASPVYDRYKSGEGYHAVPPPYIGTFMPPKPDLVFHDAPTVNETIPTAFNVELSTTKLNKDLSQSNRPTVPIIKDSVSDSEDESEGEYMPTQKAPSFFQTTEQVKTPRPYVKPVEYPILANNLRKDIPKSKGHRHSRNRKTCFVCKSLTHLIKDCDYYEKKMVQKHTTVQPQRPTTHVVTKAHPPIRRPINSIPSPPASNFHHKVTAAKAPQGNPQHALKDKGVIDSGCSRHMTWNISYLYDFEEINGRYVAFGGNPKGVKIIGKGKIRTYKLDFDDVYFVKELKFNLFSPDENHVLLRVPRENNMYNVDLKNIVPSGDWTCLFANATLDESNLSHRRLGHIDFKTMNKLVKVNTACYVQNKVLVTKPHNKIPYELLLGRTPSIGFMRPFGCPVTILNTLDPLGKFDGKADEGFLVGNSNTDDDVTFEVKEPESEVHVSPSSSAKIKKHDDKTQREAKVKSPVELSIGFGNLIEEFEDFSDNNINKVNATSTLVPAVRKNSTNITNTFSAAGPSNTAISPTLGKSSYVVPSQYPDDPNMPTLEDITYSDDEEDVGAETGFSNLETSIPVSPIPTTRVHKDHPVTQIIGDLFLVTQTRSMTRMVKDQGLQVKQNQDRIFISHDKYVAEILRKFGLTDGKSASTPIDTEKSLLNDPDGEDVDVHTYRSMIGSLIYLTSSRPDIMFAVYACAHFHVTPKASHLHAVKRIFRYLKGKPHLGLWYPKDSPFNLVAYLDSDYAGASLDRKSTTGGYQFLGYRLISWQCKKKTVVATSFTEAEYVAAVSCCAQVLWIQNQLLDYRDVGAHQVVDDVAADDIVDVATDNVANEVTDVVDEDVAKLTPPSPTPAITPPPSQELHSISKVAPTLPPSTIAQPSSPTLQQQPSQPSHDAAISMDLLNTLLETCTTLTRKVEALEQHKIAQAL